MTNKLAEIRARHDAATPGPWRWRGNASSYDVHLRSIRSPLNVVLDYVRWGFQGCIPVFRDGGVLTRARLVASAPHNAWDIVGIDHPDARAIEHSWEDIDWLLAEIGRLRDSIVDKQFHIEFLHQHWPAETIPIPMVTVAEADILLERARRSIAEEGTS